MIKNGIIIAPINAADPYRVLGIGQYNGWWDIGYICSNEHGKINMWSKYKPVNYNSKSELTEEEYAETNYGLTIPIFTFNDWEKWIYEPPVDLYRLLDFQNYNHMAIIPFDFDFPNYITINSTGVEVTFYFDIAVQGFEEKKETNISLAEVMGDYYLCVVIRNGATYATRYITSELTLKELTEEQNWSPSLTVPFKGFMTMVQKDLEIYACLSSIKYTEGTDSPILSNLRSLQATKQYATKFIQVSDSGIWDDVGAYGLGVLYSATQNVIVIQGFDITINNSGQMRYDFNLSVEYKLSNISDEVNQEGVMWEGEINLKLHESLNVRQIIEEIRIDMTNVTDYDSVRLEVWYTLHYQGSSKELYYQYLVPYRPS